MMMMTSPDGLMWSLKLRIVRKVNVITCHSDPPPNAHTHTHKNVRCYPYVHTCIRTCIHTYIHTFIHAYIHRTSSNYCIIPIWAAPCASQDLSLRLGRGLDLLLELQECRAQFPMLAFARCKAQKIGK